MGAMQAAFVKFFGRAGTRTAWDAPVLDVLERTGAHWAGTYPAGRRPRSVRDGDRMFMAQLVARRGVADIAVFGRALALAYVEGRDDASAEDIALRPAGRTTSACTTASSSPGRSPTPSHSAS
jgi:hypothetical protein